MFSLSIDVGMKHKALRLTNICIELIKIINSSLYRIFISLLNQFIREELLLMNEGILLSGYYLL